MRGWPVLLVALLASGCAANFDETTLVRIRTPSAVSAGAFTPSGYEELLPAGVEPATTEAEVPASTPPLTAGFKYAKVKRAPLGTVSIECPSCGKGYTAATVVGDSFVSMNRSAPASIAWSADGKQLGMRYVQEALFQCPRNGVHCPREALALSLTTPRDNVVEIFHRATIDPSTRSTGWASLVIGSLLFTLGATVGAVLTAERGEVGVTTFVPSVPFMAAGGFFFVTGLRRLIAHDHEEIIYASGGRSR